MSTKPTAQELQQAARELIESETFSPEVNDFWDELIERAAELASRRQEPNADEMEELAEELRSLQLLYPQHVRDVEVKELSAAALRAYAASLRSKA